MLASRDDDLARAARVKATAPFADPTWHPNERVESVYEVVVRNAGIDEEMYLIITSSENVLGARVNGRILLAFSPQPLDPVGGVFFVLERRTRYLQSLYVDPDFRGGRAVSLLLDAAKRLGITKAVGPYSTAGEKVLRRAGFVLKA